MFDDKEPDRDRKDGVLGISTDDRIIQSLRCGRPILLAFATIGNAK
jgi:hypothetical protein